MSGRTLSIPTAEVFEPLIEPARYKGAWGGRGSGKSHFFGGKLVEDSLYEKGLLSVCIREVQKTLKDSSMRLITQKLQDFRLGEADGFRVWSDRIETPGDGVIVFQGMQDHTAESIKSLEGFKRAWWEEAQTASKKSLNLLRPTMRTEGSELWFSWNARLKTDPVDVMLRGPEIPTGAVVVKANWRDNPWFYDGELEQERQDCLRQQADQYDHIWEGGYLTVAEGAYFARCLADAKDRIGRVAADPLMRIRTFWDLGGRGQKSDATAIWATQFIGKEVRVLDYYEAVGQPLAAHVNWMHHQGYTPDRADIWLPHDGAPVNPVADASWQTALQSAGYDVTVVPNQGAGAAMKRVEAVRRIFPQCWFNEASTEGGRAALGWYHEKKDETRNIGLGPEHDWSSHGADAFGLMAVAYESPTDQVDLPKFTPRKVI